MLYFWLIAALYTLLELYRLALMFRACRAVQPMTAGWVAATPESLPPQLRQRIQEGVEALRPLGFEPALSARNTSVPSFAQIHQAIVELRSPAEPALRAFVSGLQMQFRAQTSITHAFEFTSTTGRGQNITTSAMPGLGDHQSDHSLAFRFPQLRDPALLLEAHRRLVPRYGGARPNPAASIKLLNDTWRRGVDELLARGSVRVSADGTTFRPRLAPALADLARWLPGVRHLRAWSARRRQTALLRELGLSPEALATAATYRLPSEPAPPKNR